MAFFATLFKSLHSRTVWAGAVTTTIGGTQLAASYAPQILPFLPPTSKLAAIITILAGVGAIIGRIKAKQPLGPVIDKTIAQTVEAVHTLGISKGAPDTVAGQVQQIATVTAAVKAAA